jgi:hypothetical protein
MGHLTPPSTVGSGQFCDGLADDHEHRSRPEGACESSVPEDGAMQAAGMGRPADRRVDTRQPRAVRRRPAQCLDRSQADGIVSPGLPFDLTRAYIGT